MLCPGDRHQTQCQCSEMVTVTKSVYFPGCVIPRSTRELNAQILLKNAGHLQAVPQPQCVRGVGQRTNFSFLGNLAVQGRKKVFSTFVICLPQRSVILTRFRRSGQINEAQLVGEGVGRRGGREPELYSKACSNICMKVVFYKPTNQSFKRYCQMNIFPGKFPEESLCFGP